MIRGLLRAPLIPQPPGSSTPPSRTGSEIIVWGGVWEVGRLNTGGEYNPGADLAASSTANAPVGRGGAHRSIWTGTEMIVWGRYDDGLVVPFKNGEHRR